MRAGIAVSFLVAMSLPGPARAQSDTDEVPVILLHPGVSTILQLPEEIEQARLLDREELRFAILGDRLYIRPRPGTPAGVEALLEVETRTLLRTFQVRVVRRARDAHLNVLVLPAEGQQAIEESTPELPPVVPLEPPVAPVAPAVSVSTSGPGPAGPPAGPEPAPTPAEPVPARAVAPSTERAPAAARPRRIELSVHAVAALGTTAVNVPGYEALQARQPHRAFSMRVAIRRPGAWWSVEANVGSESLAAPTVHFVKPSDTVRQVILMSGPRLQADVGMKARVGSPWSVTTSVALGLLAHHRDIATGSVAGEGADGLTGDMPRAGVLALSLGLEYRAKYMLLGLELDMRQGVPADYHSMSARVSVGWFLPQENEP